MSTPKEPRIFLSYASPNLETAWKVYNYLTENGYSVWFDKKDLRQGHDWAEGITRGVDACTLILVLISQHSNHNQNVRSEVNLASQRRLEMKGVLLEELVLSSHLNYHLSAVQFVNAHQVPEKDWLRNLNSALRAFHPMGYQDSYVEPIIEDPIPPSLTALNAGTKLRDNRYQVVSLLGQGHFGMTYICTDAHMTDRKVVVKEYVKDAGRWEGKTKLIPFEDKSESFQKGLSKFAEEARRLTQITDVGQNMPYIPHIYDFFQENGTAYYVMPYYQGQNLWAKIQEGRRPIALKEALNLLTPVLDALTYLHGHNFLHRDLKPDNLFRTKAGKNLPATTILIDFGLAREMVDGYGMSSGFVGALGFAPPEQLIAGEPQGAWTDVYAFTGTLFCLVTGKFPNKEHGNWNRMDFGTPDLVTQRLRALLNKGMAKSRIDRYKDITALRTDWEVLVLSFDEAEEEAKRQKIAQQVTNAENLMRQKAWREAITLLESIRKIAPDHEKVSELLLEARLQQRLEEAAKEQAAKKKAGLEKLLQAAKTAFKRQDYQTAQTKLHTLLHEAPDHAEASDILKAVEAQIKAEQAQADEARRQQEAEAAARNKQLEAEKQAALEAAEREKAVEAQIKAEQAQADEARRQQEAEAAARNKQLEAEKQAALEAAEREKAEKQRLETEQAQAKQARRQLQAQEAEKRKQLEAEKQVSLLPEPFLEAEFRLPVTEKEVIEEIKKPLSGNAEPATLSSTAPPDEPKKPQKRWIWGSLVVGAVLVVFNLWPKTPVPTPPAATTTPQVQSSKPVVKHHSGEAGEINGIAGVYVVSQGQTLFWMKHEVTQKEFMAFVEATGLVTASEQKNGCKTRIGNELAIKPELTWRNAHNNPNAPVVCITWQEARDYLNWIGGQGWRLPNVAEWQAALGSQTNANAENAWTYENAKNQAQTVMTRQANDFGLYDLQGNVWEWAEDAQAQDRRILGGSFLFERQAANPDKNVFDAPMYPMPILDSAAYFHFKPSLSHDLFYNHSFYATSHRDFFASLRICPKFR